MGINQKPNNHNQIKIADKYNPQYNNGQIRTAINSNTQNADSVYGNLNQDEMQQIENNVNDIIRTLGELFDSVRHQMSFGEFSKITSDFIDRQILECCKKEHITYIAGTCMFTVDKSKKDLNTVIELYFKDYAGEWAKKTLNGKTRLSKFTEEARKTEITEIYRSGGLKADIDPPTIYNR